MKTLILSLGLIMIFCVNAYSQPSDSTLIKKRKKYYVNENRVSKSQLINIYSSCPKALNEYKKAKRFNISGNLLTWGGLSYFVISYYMISVKRENDYTDWWNSQWNSNGSTGDFDDSKYKSQKLVNSVIGLGICASGIILLATGNNHYQKAVNLYNGRHNDTCSIPIQLNLTINSNGLGIRLMF